MAKKTALITGITGQDGSYLAEFLLKKDYEVARTFMNCTNWEMIINRFANPNFLADELYDQFQERYSEIEALFNFSESLKNPDDFKKFNMDSKIALTHKMTVKNLDKLLPKRMQADYDKLKKLLAIAGLSTADSNAVLFNMYGK